MVKSANAEGDFHFSQLFSRRKSNHNYLPVPLGFFAFHPDPTKICPAPQKIDALKIPRRIRHPHAACQECINAGVAQRCIHNLGNLPPWKSVMKLSQIRRIYPKKQQREFEIGNPRIPEDSGEGYIDSQLLIALKEKPRFVLEDPDRFTKYGSDSTRSATEGAKWDSPQSHTRAEAKRSSSGRQQCPQSAHAHRGQRGSQNVPRSTQKSPRMRPHPNRSHRRVQQQRSLRPRYSPTPQNRPKSTPVLTRPAGGGGGGGRARHSLLRISPAQQPLEQRFLRQKRRTTRRSRTSRTALPPARPPAHRPPARPPARRSPQYTTRKQNSGPSQNSWQVS